MNHTQVREPAVPLVKIKPGYQVTIPYAVRERIPLDIGDLVEVEARYNFIIMKPKAVKDRAGKEEIEAAIADALKDIEEGQVSGPFATADELVSHLHRQVV